MLLLHGTVFLNGPERWAAEEIVRINPLAGICTYLAMAITRKQLAITTNLTTFVQVLSLHAISKVPIESLFADVTTSQTPMQDNGQLLINDL